jgi:3-oxoacyl-[acyl-carrier protein] reductase
VQPGPIDTDMNPDNTEFASFIKTKMPSGAYGKAENVADLVAFLAAEAAQYINGSVVTIDGGFS